MSRKKWARAQRRAKATSISAKKLLHSKRFTLKSKEAILKGKVPNSDTPPRIFMHAGRDGMQPAVGDIHANAW